MKVTGIVRKIDNLAPIVISKEINGISEFDTGSSLEIF